MEKVPERTRRRTKPPWKFARPRFVATCAPEHTVLIEVGKKI